MSSEPTKKELSEFDCEQLALEWHLLGSEGIDIGRKGVKLNQLIAEGNETLHDNLIVYRAKEEELGHNSLVRVTDKALELFETVIE